MEELGGLENNNNQAQNQNTRVEEEKHDDGEDD